MGVMLGLVTAVSPGCREPNPAFDEVASSAGSSTVAATTDATTVSATSAVTESATSIASVSGSGSTSAVDDSTSEGETSVATTGPQPCRGDMCLVDRGVIVRYFMNDGAPGEEPFVLRDAIDPPLDLFLTYGPELQFIEEGAGRGLEWSEFGQDSRASVFVDGSKVAQALEGSSTATIELVIRMMQVHELGSRISHIGQANERGQITLSSVSPGVLELHWQNNDLLALWNVGATLVERHVVHVVLDTDDPVPEDRVRMFIDGEFVAPVMQTPPTQGRGISLEMGRHYVLGNREIGERTFQGTMFYASLYQSALTVEEVGANAATLAVFDD